MTSIKVEGGHNLDFSRFHVENAYVDPLDISNPTETGGKRTVSPESDYNEDHLYADVHPGPYAELGPEPDPIQPRQNWSRTSTHSPKVDDSSEPLTWYQIVPDATKAKVSIVAAVVCLIVFSSMYFSMRPQMNTGSPNDATWIRKATGLEMMNASESPCNKLFDFSCGTFDSRFPTSSLFTQTQNQVNHEIVSSGIIATVQTHFNSIQNAGRPSAETLASYGMWGCVDFEVLPDYTDTSVAALYLSVPCEDCHPYRYSPGPQRVSASDIPTSMPASAQETIRTALTSNLNVWFFSGEELADRSLVEVYAECNTTGIEVWETRVANATVSQIARTLYRDAVDETMACSQENTQASVVELIRVCKSLLVSYITNGASFVKTKHLKSQIVSRIKDVRVNFGGGSDVIVTCSPEINIPTCLRATWSRQMHLLRYPRGSNGTTWNLQTVWPIASSEVNAVYSSLENEGKGRASSASKMKKCTLRQVALHVNLIRRTHGPHSPSSQCLFRGPLHDLRSTTRTGRWICRWPV